MAKYGVYSIRDKHTGFMTPVIDQSEGSAIRNFARAVNNDNSLFDFAPADFDLYCIGEFDDKSGMIAGVEPLKFLMNGESLVGVKYEK